MMLSDLLSRQGLDTREIPDVSFNSIQINSKKVQPGDLFLALRGSHKNGQEFIPEALERGAAGVMTDTTYGADPKRVFWIPGLPDLFPNILLEWAGHPESHLECMAVTGTNGKTTVAGLIAQLLKEAGRQVISLGTIENNLNGTLVPASLTTPDPVELVTLLKKGVELGGDTLVMEASSHALHQGRLGALRFDRAVFTNLTQDHLDYHRDMEEYFLAKTKLFTHYLRSDGMAIINIGNEYGQRLQKMVGQNSLSYSANPDHRPDIQLRSHQLSLNGTQLEIEFQGQRHEFNSRLVGQINLENILALIALGFSLKLPTANIQKALEKVQVRGRNQMVLLKKARFCVVDYAHTPDALERVLKSFRPLVGGRLFTVFGCGGDRDKGKRPLMGRAASQLSDHCIIANDNPRTEDPESIARDILQGIPDKSRVTLCLDRKEAIHKGLSMLGEGDCLVIAGKGHEDYQIFGDVKQHFSDIEVVENWAEQNEH